jgi:hypothetical protein
VAHVRGRAGRLAVEEHHAHLLAAEDDAGVRGRLARVRAARGGRRAAQERAEHPRAVAHVVVGVVARELEHVAREEAERRVRRAQHGELRGEREDLELDGRCLQRD